MIYKASNTAKKRAAAAEVIGEQTSDPPTSLQTNPEATMARCFSGDKINKETKKQCTTKAKKRLKTETKTCSHEGCTNVVQNRGVCYRHGAKVQLCSHEGCKYQAKKGGLCIRHFNQISLKIDSADPNNIVTAKGSKKRKLEGLHGEKAKLEKKKKKKKKKMDCSYEGCTNQARNGRVCVRHGAQVQLCSHEGCTNNAITGGVCRRHGAKVYVYPCSHEGCTNNALKGGLCTSHGAKRKTCKHEGCTNQVRQGGVCIKHGAKINRKKCSHEGCTNRAKTKLGVWLSTWGKASTC